MNRWVIGSLVGIVGGVGAYLLATQRESTSVENALGPPAIAAPKTVAKPEPVVLPRVIETADIDPLLDPSAKPVTGVPFDEDTTPVPGIGPTQTTIPDRIPPAEDKGREEDSCQNRVDD
jgi:hypothetical protein